MFRIMLAFVLAIIAMPLPAQQPQPMEVDTAAVLRRGDMVTVMGEGPRSGPEEMFIAAMAPPEDDSDQWYVTLWTQPNCPHCERLKADFAKTPDLSCFVAAPANRRPWAHYNVFSSADRTQQWRRDRYKVGSYPTLVIQPPRDGSFGPPDNVVVQLVGYDGNAAALAKRIQDGVKFYTAKMSEQGKIPPKRSTSALAIDASRGWGQIVQAEPVGVDPPFPAPARDDTPAPVWSPFPPAPAQPQPTAQPAPGGEAEAIAKVISWVASLFGLTIGSGFVHTIILGILALLAWKRTFTPSAPTDPPTTPPVRPAA